MQDPIVLEDEAFFPENFDTESFFQDTIGITTYRGKAEKISLIANSIAAKYIASQPFHKSQKIISENQDQTTFELTILVSEEFIRNLLGYGGEVEIIAPLSLRKQVHERIQKMNDIYSRK
jgi:predicted DNA-binding transcriptional regulator YafY